MALERLQAAKMQLIRNDLMQYLLLFWILLLHCFFKDIRVSMDKNVFRNYTEFWKIERRGIIIECASAANIIHDR